jgi:acylphosphatase
MNKGIHCFVTGRVQGVCFRMATQKQANQYGLTGWVRNLPDGQVEVMAFGNQQQLDELNHWLKSGPSMAQVTNLQCETIDYQDFEGFSVR